MLWVGGSAGTNPKSDKSQRIWPQDEAQQSPVIQTALSIVIYSYGVIRLSKFTDYCWYWCATTRSLVASSGPLVEIFWIRLWGTGERYNMSHRSVCCDYVADKKLRTWWVRLTSISDLSTSTHFRFCVRFNSVPVSSEMLGGQAKAGKLFNCVLRRTWQDITMKVS